MEDLPPGKIAQTKNQGDGFKTIQNPTLNMRKYQLNVNIVRMEDVAQVGTGSINPFIAGKVGNITLNTSTIYNSQKPEFSCRLKFPVTIPAQNDQIVLKAWDYVSIGRDNFIANIPENPFIDPYFNITFLQQDKNFPFTWINLYSIPKRERQGGFSKLLEGKNRLVEGTDYMGRVLLSMNLI